MRVLFLFLWEGYFDGFLTYGNNPTRHMQFQRTNGPSKDLKSAQVLWPESFKKKNYLAKKKKKKSLVGIEPDTYKEQTQALVGWSIGWPTLDE